MKWAVLAMICGMLAACNRDFEPITYGKDACTHCKMTIMDRRFAAEMIDKRGNVFKFDDIACMRRFMQTKQPEAGALFFVEDYRQKETQGIGATRAVYLQHAFFHSPMNGNCAAFATAKDAGTLKDSLQTTLLTWETIP